MNYVAIKKKLAEKGYTVKNVCRETGLRKDTVSNFLAGRTVKAGKRGCRIMREFLTGLGLVRRRRTRTILRENYVCKWVLSNISRELTKAAVFQCNHRANRRYETKHRYGDVFHRDKSHLCK